MNTAKDRRPQTPGGAPNSTSTKAKNQQQHSPRSKHSNPMGARKSSVLPGNPCGDLIEDARIYDLDISQNEAAARAGMHGNQWRTIVREKKSDESRCVPTAKSLARCAVAVNVPAYAFGAIGRIDVATEILKLKMHQRIADRSIDAGSGSVLDQLLTIQESFGDEAFWVAIDILLNERADHENPGKVGVGE